MDPVAVITLAIALGEKLVTLMRMALKKVRKRRPNVAHHCQLQHELSLLSDCLLHLKSAIALGFGSQALENLLEELVSSVQHTQKLLQPPHKNLTSQDICGYQELFISKFKSQVQSALREVPKNNNQQPMVSEEVNAIQDLIAQKPEEKEMIAMIMSILQKEMDHINLTFKEALAFEWNMLYLTEIFRMLFNTMHPFQHHDQLPLLLVSEAEKDGSCKSKEADEAGRRSKKAPARMNNVVEEKKTRGQALDEEKPIESLKGINYGPLCNPNSMLTVAAQEDKGDVHVSKCDGKQWKVIYQGSSLAEVRIVKGERQMQLSAKLGYIYYEVTLVQMVELAYSTKPGLAGVGVGLAYQAKSKTVAGRYEKSYGYDGRMGQANNAGKPWVNEIGSLVSGDTLGIGLCTHHGGPPLVFLTKNGVLEGCKSDSRIAQFSSELYPVISLASLHVEILVNFCGPFILPSMSDLVEAAQKNHF